MSLSLKKIVLLGPESTGKTTLCQQLAKHFDTLWVEEYARHYLNTNGKEYTKSDIDNIVLGQIQNEEATTQLLHKNISPYLQQSATLFIDTDLYVLKIWSEIAFNHCNNKILNEIASRKYDLYLLCEPDIPWEKDALREHPDEKIRTKIFHHYKDAMIHQHVPWQIINGKYEERLARAIDAVNKLFF